jgi:hypothetical protein
MNVAGSGVLLAWGEAQKKHAFVVVVELKAISNVFPRKFRGFQLT